MTAKQETRYNMILNKLQRAYGCDNIPYLRWRTSLAKRHCEHVAELVAIQEYPRNLRLKDQITIWL